jgi:hypothetical protein
VLWRVHRPALDPCWFGPAAGDAPLGRFDDPLRDTARAGGTFGVCYLGATREAAFAETFLRWPAPQSLSRDGVDSRHLAELVALRPLRLVALLGSGLAAVGATAAVTHGAHSVARRWARALWEHPSAPDGIAYHCRHDDGEVAIALFDRARDAIEPVATRGLRADRAWFGATLDRYRLALDPP